MFFIEKNHVHDMLDDFISTGKIMKSFCCKLLLILTVPLLAYTETEDLIFELTDTRFHVDYTASNEHSSIYEMTIEGETVNNWSELVTIQKIPRINAPFEDFYKYFTVGLRRDNPDYSCGSRIISSNENSIFFEWWLEGKGPNAQHEWYRMIQNSKDCFILRYTTKKLGQVEKIRSTWEKCLQEAHIGNLKNSHQIQNLEKLDMIPKIECVDFKGINDAFSIPVPKYWSSSNVIKSKKDNGYIYSFAIPNKKGSFCIVEMINNRDYSENDQLELLVKEMLKKFGGSLIRYEKMDSRLHGEITGAILGPQKMSSGVIVNEFLAYVHTPDKSYLFMATAPVEIFEEKLIEFKAVIPTLSTQ